MEQNVLTISSHPDFLENAMFFQKNYDLADLVMAGDKRYAKRNLKSYFNRSCIFCGHNYPDTSFSNYSHLLPKMIGNSSMYSDFECDVCNEYFSGLENDLASYLGVSRSIAGLKNQKKAPSLKAHRLTAKSRSFVGDNILIIAPEDLKRVDDKMIFTYTKNSYTPSNVYRALLKSGLSLLKDSDVKEKYKRASSYLMGKIGLNKGAYVGGYRLPFHFNMPLHVYCFRSKTIDGKIPEHVLSFYFQNHIISILMPSDETHANFSVMMPPPYFSNESMNNEVLRPFLQDLSSTTEVLNDEENVVFQFDPKDFENISCYDSINDKYESISHDPTNTKYLILAKDGVSVDPKKLSKFVKDQMEGDQL